MKSYQLIYNNDLFLKIINNTENICIDNKLLNNLYKNKCKIDKVDINKWEKYKKLHNDYEYIYTSSNKSKNIADIIPISRSYFKLHEIIKDFNIENLDYCSCIAEGPGGFINCLLNKNNCMLIYGITLLSNDKKIPFWSTRLFNNPRVLLNKYKNTGDIYLKKTSDDFIKRVKKSILVTADGGFDYSNDFNKQELMSYKLIYSEIYIALNIQQNNGTFVLKVFDIFYHKTIQLLYLLFLSYDKVYIYKPTVSRLSNSEKYIVCTGFKGFNKEIIDILVKYYNNVDNLYIELPDKFIDVIKQYNNIFVQNQIDYINEILEFNCKNINERIKNQIECSKEWCVKYNIPVNNNFYFF
jgi:cap1 methyltransferase